MSAAEGVSKPNIAEQANECMVRANGRASGPVLTSRFLAVLAYFARATRRKRGRETEGKSSVLGKEKQARVKLDRGGYGGSMVLF